MSTLKITINPIGVTKVEADGFEGVKCLKATESILAALSSEDKLVTEEKFDMYLSTDDQPYEVEGI